MPQMIIANRLADGRVVFLDAAEGWVTDIEAGRVLGEDEAPDALALAQRHEAECRIVEPTLIEVTGEDGARRPVAIREAIRAFGPTVTTGLSDSAPAGRRRAVG